MKKICLLIIVCCYSLVYGQEEKATPTPWNFNADANFYFFSDEFIFLPVLKADKNALHLEARYNYEDLQTVSIWSGYNFSGGKEFEYTITPMIGGVMGLTKGIAPGVEVTLAYKGFELYNEGEFLFDLGSTESHFFYNWVDFTYSPTDWLWFGISGQRTRLYKTDLDLQRGFLIGGGLKNWELSGYLYNLGFDDPFALLTLSVSF